MCLTFPSFLQFWVLAFKIQGKGANALLPPASVSGYNALPRFSSNYEIIPWKTIIEIDIMFCSNLILMFQHVLLQVSWISTENEAGFVQEWSIKTLKLAEFCVLGYTAMYLGEINWHFSWTNCHNHPCKKKKKSKPILVTGRGGPYDCETIGSQMAVRSSPCAGHPLFRQHDSWYLFRSFPRLFVRRWFASSPILLWIESNPRPSGLKHN
jgi:hypothetical protein